MNEGMKKGQKKINVPKTHESWSLHDLPVQDILSSRVRADTVLHVQHTLFIVEGSVEEKGSGSGVVTNDLKVKEERVRMRGEGVGE